MLFNEGMEDPDAIFKAKQWPKMVGTFYKKCLILCAEVLDIKLDMESWKAYQKKVIYLIITNLS